MCILGELCGPNGILRCYVKIHLLRNLMVFVCLFVCENVKLLHCEWKKGYENSVQCVNHGGRNDWKKSAKIRKNFSGIALSGLKA